MLAANHALAVPLFPVCVPDVVAALHVDAPIVRYSNLTDLAALPVVTEVSTVHAAVAIA